MTKFTFLLLATAFIASASMIGCQSPADKVENAYENKEEAQEDLTKAEDRYQIEMDSFKAEMATKVEGNEASMKELRAQAKADKEAVRKEMNMKLDKLEEQNNKLKQKLADYKHTGDQEWNEFKAELNRDMDELGTAFSNLRTKNNN